MKNDNSMLKHVWLYPLGFLLGGLTYALPIGFDLIPIAVGAIVVFVSLRRSGEL